MATDLALQPARDQSWLTGLTILLGTELHAFCGTRPRWVPLRAPPVPRSLLAVAALGFSLLFFAALSLCLGALFSSRGPVVAIPLLAVLTGQPLHLSLPRAGAALLPAGPSALSVSAPSSGSASTA